MARPLRIQFENALYHVTARAIERRKIVANDRDRAKWIEYLLKTVERHDLVVYAFVLMDNHYHLFVRTPRANLSRAIHDLSAAYAGWFNKRHGRVGHLMAGRFKAVLVDSKGYYWEVSRYIHLNPVRAGMVKKPEDYKWSSYPGYHWPSRKLDWIAYEEVLGEAGKKENVYARYREFVRAGTEVPPESPLVRVVEGLLLGGEKFVKGVKRVLGAKGHSREVPQSRKFRERPTFERICGAVCEEYGADISEIEKKRRRGSAAKQAAVYVAREVFGLPVGEIAGKVGRVGLSAVTNMVSRVRATAEEDDALARRLANIRERLMGSAEA